MNEADVFDPLFGALNPICPPSPADADTAPRVKVFSIGPNDDVPIAIAPDTTEDPVTFNDPVITNDPVMVG